MKQTTITLNGATFILKQSFRSLIAFEALTGKNAYEINPSVGDSIKVFYCMLNAANPDFPYTLDTFMDQLDEHPEAMAEFNSFLLSTTKL